MDAWGFEQLTIWLEHRVLLPVGPLFCVIDGPTRGQAWASSAVRTELRRLATQAGVRRRFAPHQLRHGHAVELAHEGMPVNIIQRQLGHTDTRHDQHVSAGNRPQRDVKIINTIHARRPPTITATAGLNL